MLGKLLVAIPSVIVLRCLENEAEIEMCGVRGMAQLGELGICIGAILNIREATDAWIERTTLLLSTSDMMRDFCVSCGGGKWVLWRWYGGMPQRISEEFVQTCEEKLAEHLALAAYFARRGAVARASSQWTLDARLA